MSTIREQSLNKLESNLRVSDIHQHRYLTCDSVQFSQLNELPCYVKAYMNIFKRLLLFSLFLWGRWEEAFTLITSTMYV